MDDLVEGSPGKQRNATAEHAGIDSPANEDYIMGASDDDYSDDEEMIDNYHQQEQQKRPAEVPALGLGGMKLPPREE